MKLKRADLREKKANSDHFYVGNKLVYDFIAANTTKKKDCGTKLKKNSYVLSSSLRADVSYFLCWEGAAVHRLLSSHLFVILNLAAEKIVMKCDPMF